ncbi:MAG: multidrug efflux pump subunit AcrA (membrane-fusion protein) [Kiritimatiellia bacterium]|jgi:HlyD family secretion protein
MNKKLKLAVALGALAVAVMVGMGSRRTTAEKFDRPLTATVSRGPMTILVSASGEVEALKSTKIIPRIKRTAIVSYVIEEGTRVEAGKIIGRLNDEELLLAIRDDRQEIDDEEVALNDAKAQLEIQNIVAKTNLKAAQDALKAAEMELKKFDEADSVMSIRTTELELNTAESNLTRSQKRYADLQTLLKEGFITEDEVEEGRIALETEKVNLETRTMDLKVLNEFTLPLSRQELVNKLSKATTGLEKTRTEDRSMLHTRERAVQKVERNLENSRRTLEEKLEEHKEYVVKTPTDGLVHYGDTSYRYNRANVEVGGTIYAGATLFTIPDLTGMKAMIDVPESEVHKVALGQKVTLKVDAVPDTLYSGTVNQVAEVAKSTSSSRSTGVKEFEVSVLIDKDEGLKPGYSCEAEIVTAELVDALQIPVQAVFRDEDAFYVYLARADGPRRSIVRIGAASITHVQILDGLSEEQVVYLTPPPGQAEQHRD